jgi:hypothetical protein
MPIGERKMRTGNALNSADADDVSAQIDLIGVSWLMIGKEPSAAQNEGYLRAACRPRRHRP